MEKRGRKALPPGEKRVTLTVRIKPSIYCKLPDKGKGQLIENLLNKYFEDKK